ncbi:hypothetical protein [Mycobacterium mantenii]|uniref:Uncharacterized protein n=1 Tax=Mycobacterium mantenii TaxID=560555 RepID=A0A1A2THH4_MYCNT|nr:hypothetical protein [Mycobacterium mantenii]OBH42268.1 hypothetical protein A5688_15400 [Mycobacterium mantenii]OBH60255.1 hypothetical protein A5687_19175 [Mycobacterium mantenii]OBH75080.1 hypothetical protein A5683_23220 [Mycobacterium mantenii]OBH75492.1 hypothetical protein A5682_25890 [Mycobacterium mantenii]
MIGRTALADVDLLIGIDDTDNPYTPGTGRRARALLHELHAAGLGSPAGATRHQLLVDDRIPYTSHNSSACLAWRSPDGDPHAVRTRITELAGQFLERVCPPDADPGLAVVVPGELAAAAAQLIEFGRRAKREVLHANEARELAAALGVHLSGHGGTREGMTGALAAIGLHLSGNDGLFITLPGIRKLPDQATIETIFALAPIDVARDDMHRRPRSGEMIELGDWVRPVLLDGLAVLLLEPPCQLDDGNRMWRTAPRAVVKRY